MAKNLFLFDVDGTIAESGQKITSDMAAILVKLKEHGEIGIVGGGKLDKVLDQMDNQVYFDHYFTECGCVYHKNKSIGTNALQLEEIYKKNLREHPLYKEINVLIKHCLQFLSNVDYTLSGYFIDLRNGIIYVSLIGLVATQLEREAFIKLNNKNRYRETLLKSLHDILKRLDLVGRIDIVEGGSVGIAIYPSEYDKVQVLEQLIHSEKNCKKDYKNVYYFGDKYEPNGNDYKMINHRDVVGMKVDNYKDTIEKLENLLLHQCNK
jgi:phosphomannomutase